MNPLDAKSKLSKDITPLTSKNMNSIASVPYQSLLGSLVYRMINTRAHITNVVRVVNQYITNRGPLH